MRFDSYAAKAGNMSNESFFKMVSLSILMCFGMVLYF